jgi:hypothetical protein
MYVMVKVTVNETRREADRRSMRFGGGNASFVRSTETGGKGHACARICVAGLAQRR